jgi:hypothetical protein
VPANTTPAARATSSTPLTGPAGQLTATTGDGDKISATFAFSDLEQPAAAGDALSSCSGIDTSRALVERMDVTVTVESSLAAEVAIHWNPNILYAPVTDLTGFYIASDFSDGPTCDQVDDTLDPLVHWPSLEPGTPQTFTAYWVFSQAVSPANPQGDLKGLGQLLLQPEVLIQQSAATTTLSGPRYVQCAQPDGVGAESGFYLAGDRPTSLPVGGLSEDLACT